MCIITNHANNQRIISLIEYRMGELEKKQDKHNSVIERTYHIEQELAVIAEKQKVANHRIDALEGDN